MGLLGDGNDCDANVDVNVDVAARMLSRDDGHFFNPDVD